MKIKKNFSQQILIMAVFTMTAVSLWLYLSVRTALVKSEKPVLTPQETKVLNPTLDESIFEELKKRKI